MMFTVRGVPVGQPRARITTRGRFAHAYTPKSHPVHAWKAAVRQAAIAAMRDKTHAHGFPAGQGVPVSVELWFSMPRPASHLNAAGELRKGKPLFHTSKPDTDNLVKAVFDALTEAEVWHDDSQVIRHLVEKVYSTSLPTGATIKILRWS